MNMLVFTHMYVLYDTGLSSRASLKDEIWKQSVLKTPEK